MTVQYHDIDHDHNHGDTEQTSPAGENGHNEEWRHRGFTQVENCVLRDRDLSPMARFTYAILRSYGWQDQVCWPGMERLANDIGRAKKQVRGYINELEDAGLISRKRVGQGNTNRYRFAKPLTTTSEGTPAYSLDGTLAYPYEDTADKYPSTPPGGSPPGIDHRPESKEPGGGSSYPAHGGEPSPTTSTPTAERGSEHGLVRDAVKDLIRGVEAGGGSILKGRKNRYAGEVKRLVEEEGVGREELEKVVARVVERYRDIPLSAEAALEDVRNGRGAKRTASGAQPAASQPATPQPGVDALKAHQTLSDVAWIAEHVDLTGGEPPQGRYYFALGGTDRERGDNLARVRSVVRRAVKEAQVEDSEPTSHNTAARITSEGREAGPEGSDTSSVASGEDRKLGLPCDEDLRHVLADTSGPVHEDVLDYLDGATTTRRITGGVSQALGLIPTQELDDRITELLAEKEGVPA